MDFMWFWVSLAISVEVVRQGYQQCYPKKKSHATDDRLKEPLLQADGTCPYSCCVKDIEAAETDSGTDTGESSEENESDELVSEVVSDEANENSSIGDDWTQEIVARVYSAGPGRPRTVRFKIAGSAASSPLRKESSVKIHPQPDEEGADQAQASSTSKDGPSEAYRVSPPAQEVMSAHQGNSPRGDDGQSS